VPVRATWIVQLFIDGPIAIATPIRFQQPKSFNGRERFYSEINIQNTPSGLRTSVTAFARASDPARKAALVFVGEMLDVLGTELNLPLRLSLLDPLRVDQPGHSVKRVVTQPELREVFRRALVFPRAADFLTSTELVSKGSRDGEPARQILRLLACARDRC
jgi:hypothetical protein